MEDMEVLNLQFAFLVTVRDLNPAHDAYECVKENTACGEFHGTGDPEELQGDMNLQYLFSHIQHERGNAVPWFIPKKAEACWNVSRWTQPITSLFASLGSHFQNEENVEYEEYLCKS